MTKIKDFFKKLFTKENMKKFYFSFAWLMILMFVFDIASKWAVVKTFGAENANRGESITIIKNFFYIVFNTNEGAAWSLGDNNRVLWIVISVLLGGGLLAYYIIAFKKLSTWTKVGLSLMIGGAFGNLIDRAFYWKSTVGFSGVVDFLDFQFGSKHFPTFNIADASLVVGVGVLLVLVMIDLIKDGIQKTKDDERKIKESKNSQQNPDKNEKEPGIAGENEKTPSPEKEEK